MEIFLDRLSSGLTAGSIYVLVALLWLWLIEGQRPTRWDVIGSAFTPLGIYVALVFIGLPFVVRTVQPVLADFEAELHRRPNGMRQSSDDA